MTERAPYTRDAFNLLRETATRTERRDGRLLAAVAVGLGVVQLVVIQWGDRHGHRQQWLAWEGIGFLLYMVLVVWLLVRMVRRVERSRPECPQCGATLKEMSERVAVATGRCDQCGGRVVE
jgi:membrane protein implicated in regulation of membrane protease activity